MPEEQKVWTPTTGAGLGSGGYIKETTFVSRRGRRRWLRGYYNIVWHFLTHFQNEPAQEQLNGAPMGYGATQQHVANNPFAYHATITEEQVQPHAQDSYMQHGNIEENTY